MLKGNGLNHMVIGAGMEKLRRFENTKVETVTETVNPIKRIVKVSDLVTGKVYKIPIVRDSNIELVEIDKVEFVLDDISLTALGVVKLIIN